jgi:hypothetical protein
MSRRHACALAVQEVHAPALGDDDVLDALPVTMLLLERHKASVQALRLMLGDVIQRVPDA